MLSCYCRPKKFSKLISLSPNRSSWVPCWRWTRTIGVLGYSGRCSWVAVALVAMAALLTSSVLALSSPSLHPSQLVLQQMFLWNVYCTWWSMRRSSSLCNCDGLETRILHWKSTLLSVSSVAPKRGEKRASHVMILALNFELFQRVPRHLSRCMFGLSGLACV